MDIISKWVLEKRAQLAKKSLKLKWNETSNSHLNGWCSFCFQAHKASFENTHIMCSLCLCPPEICRDSGEGGIISKLFLKYSYIKKVKKVWNDPTVKSLVNELIKIYKDPKMVECFSCGKEMYRHNAMLHLPTGRKLCNNCFGIVMNSYDEPWKSIDMPEKYWNMNDHERNDFKNMLEEVIGKDVYTVVECKEIKVMYIYKESDVKDHDGILHV